jgi:hypothetical protein
VSTSSPIADIEFEASDFDIDEASILEVLFEMFSGDIDVDLCNPFIEISIELFISENREKGYSTNRCVFRDISFCDESMTLELSTLSPSCPRLKNTINFRHISRPLIFPHPRHNNSSISSYSSVIPRVNEIQTSSVESKAIRQILNNEITILRNFINRVDRRNINSSDMSIRKSIRNFDRPTSRSSPDV